MDAQNASSSTMKQLPQSKIKSFRFGIVGLLTISCALILYLFVIWNPLGSFIWNCFIYPFNINVNDVPVYPDARNVTREEPQQSLTIAVLEFTTSDDPETVWKYYVDVMGRKWGFHERPLQQGAKQLVAEKCSSYYFDMTSAQIDSNTYNITLQLSYVPYH